MVNPAITNFSGENFTCRRVKLFIHPFPSHVMKIMEATKLAHEFWIERLKHDAAENLRCHSGSQPSGAAPAGDGYDNTSAYIRIRIDSETTANPLNHPPTALSEPVSYPFQYIPFTPAITDN